MNDKEKFINEVLDIVVDCCTLDVDGKKTVSRDEVIGSCKKGNVVMTRCIFVTEMLFLGFTTETIAAILHRSEHGIRQLLNTAHQYRITSHAYRIAEAQCTLKCKGFMEA